MRGIGLIDNLNGVAEFRERRLPESSASEWMTAVGGNTGNVAFVHGSIISIGAKTTSIGWGSDPKKVRERCDRLVVACANQLGAHVDLGKWAERLKAFDLPVTLVGIGIQTTDYEKEISLPEGSYRFLEVVKQLRFTSDAANIGVRGQLTKAFLARRGIASYVIGCPSLFIARRERLGDVLRASCRRLPKKIAIAAGNPWHGATCSLEETLAEIVDKHRGAYIIQHPEAMLKILLGETRDILPQTMAQCVRAYGGRFNVNSLVEWYRENAYAFADVGSWMQFLRKFDRILGPRFHGVVLGIQTGIPGYVIHIDNRTKELCDATMIKNFGASDLIERSLDELISLTNWNGSDIEKFERRRVQNAGAFVDLLKGNEIDPSEHLCALSRQEGLSLGAAGDTDDRSHA